MIEKSREVEKIFKSFDSSFFFFFSFGYNSKKNLDDEVSVGKKKKKKEKGRKTAIFRENRELWNGSSGCN